MDLLCDDQNIHFNQGIVECKHSYGFYSCCSVLLHKLIHYYNQFHSDPIHIDTTHSFRIYKSHGKEHDNAMGDFFKPAVDDVVINKEKFIQYHCGHEQFQAFKHLRNVYDVIPFIRKYFTPTDEILDFADAFTRKYNISYDRTCVLFYRGNDKVTETPIGSYDDFVEKALNLYKNDNKIQFLVQSDETEFLDYCKQKLPKCIIMYDEIRHVKKNKDAQVDYINYKEGQNNLYAKYFLAIMIIMSKCKYIIFNSGNISLWIFYFQKIYNDENVDIHQFLQNNWY
jgi:hypothetical protein